MTETIRILIVEDTQTDYELAVREIRSVFDACAIERVQNERDFLRALETFQPHLVLSDYSLPQFNGMEALKLLKERSPLTPLILWTGSLSEDIAVESMRAGATNYVIKENLKRLGPAIAHALEERQILLDRSEAEQRLIESETRFRSLVENSSEEVSIIAADGSLLYESPSTKPTLGYPRGAFLGMDLFQLVHPDDRPDLQRQFANLLEDSKLNPRMRFRLLHHNGTWRWVEAVGTNLIAEPSVGGIVVNYHDVTEQVESEERLRYQAHILSNVKDAIFATDENYLITYWNEAAEALYGWRAEEVIGKLGPEITQTEFPGANAEEMRLHVRDQGFWRGEATQVKKDGTRFPCEIASLLLMNDKGAVTGYVSVNHDITERKQAESQRNYHARLLRNINDAVIATDDQFRITAWNRAAEIMYGWTSQEVLGKNVSEILSFDFTDEERAEAREAMGASLTARSERMHRRKDGKTIFVETNTIAIHDENHKLTGFVSVNRDVSERRLAEQALRQSENRYRSLVEKIPGLVILHTFKQPREHIYVSPAIEHILGYTPEEWKKGQTIWNQSIHPEDLDRVLQEDARTDTTGESFKIEYRLRRKNGTYIWVYEDASILTDERGQPAFWMCLFLDINERKLAEAQTLRHLSELQALYANGLAINRLLNPREIGERIIDTFSRYLSWHHVTIRLLKENSDELELIAFNVQDFRGDRIDEVEQKFRSIVKTGQGLSGSVVLSGIPVRTGKLRERPEFVAIYENMQSGLYMPLKSGDRAIGVISVESKEADAFSEQDERLLATLANQAAIAIENARLFESAQNELAERKRAVEALRVSENRFRALFEDTPIAIWEEDFSQVKKYLDQLKTRGVSEFEQYFASNPEEIVACTNMIQIIDVNRAALLMYHADTKEELIKSSENILSKGEQQHLHEDLVAIADGKTSNGWEGADETLDGEPIEINLRWTVAPGHEHDYSKVIVSTIDITDRKRAEARVQTQFQRLNALRDIDRTITSTFDLRLSLNFLISRAVSILGVDAAAVLLVNPSLNTLEYAVSMGFRARPGSMDEIHLGEGHAGRVALDREMIHIKNLADTPNSPLYGYYVKHEEMVSYYGLPLAAKGKVLGVLEVFQRRPIERDQEWLDFLESLAEQASIAIDNVQSFDGMQRLNMELIMAYDATIEGWSRAMDLRDKETEGHTQRVTEMTVKLARKMGVNDLDLIQIRRGALLHDIGKLGVPDSILLKPGTLTSDEWETMKQHTVYARDMLMAIAYLRPALDIPYCHHEKWDGSGYPQGLSGELIPLSARIFSIVDVWDALTSDRPYRRAWSADKTLEYIKEHTGKHFDPRVLEPFLEMISED